MIYHIHYTTPEGTVNRGRRMQTTILENYSLDPIGKKVYVSQGIWDKITVNRPLVKVYGTPGGYDEVFEIIPE